eukprot:37649-Prymnesium_polylepis.1
MRRTPVISAVSSQLVRWRQVTRKNRASSGSPRASLPGSHRMGRSRSAQSQPHRQSQSQPQRWQL